jgi:hypothetical protein
VVRCLIGAESREAEFHHRTTSLLAIEIHEVTRRLTATRRFEDEINHD